MTYLGIVLILQSFGEARSARLGSSLKAALKRVVWPRGFLFKAQGQPGFVLDCMDSLDGRMNTDVYLWTSSLPIVAGSVL